MHEYEVNTREQLTAAVRAAARPSYEEAKQNPVRIVFGTCTYTFNEGIHERRAEQIAKNVRSLLRKSNAAR